MSLDDSIDRREALERLAAFSLALGLSSRGSIIGAARHAAAVLSSSQDAPYVPRFFSAAEWPTVRLLSDYIIPRDDRSGSATDAGVPEFIDFIMIDQPGQQMPVRGGLHWLDTRCRDRFGAAFASCKPEQQRTALDEIAWPGRAEAEVSQGVAFFTRFRDLTASGFWSSRIGYADLQYIGNTFVQDWRGCPTAALEKLGVEY